MCSQECFAPALEDLDRRGPKANAFFFRRRVLAPPLLFVILILIVSFAQSLELIRIRIRKDRLLQCPHPPDGLLQREKDEEKGRKKEGRREGVAMRRRGDYRAEVWMKFLFFSRCLRRGGRMASSGRLAGAVLLFPLPVMNAQPRPAAQARLNFKSPLSGAAVSGRGGGLRSAFPRQVGGVRFRGGTAVNLLINRFARGDGTREVVDSIDPACDLVREIAGNFSGRRTTRRRWTGRA